MYKKRLQIIHQLILSYGKLVYLRWYGQDDFSVDLLKTGWPLIKNVIKPLAKNVLILLGLSATADAGIIKKP